MFSGLTEDPKQHLKFFDEKSNDEMVIVRDIPVSYTHLFNFFMFFCFYVENFISFRLF